MTHNVEVDGKEVLGFDTGYDARAFAQTKSARFIDEPGFIVRPSGADYAIEQWKASGVREIARPDEKRTMVIWGPPVEGERLDLLLNNSPSFSFLRDSVSPCEVSSKESSQEKALAAISAWIKAVLALQNAAHELPLWPCAATVNGSEVFFAPPTLTRLCTMRDDVAARVSGGEWYVSPHLTGMNAAAFTAAAMLYRVFAGTPPFAAADDIVLDQDMREGNFLPVRFAVPGLGGRLAYLIQYALTPVNKKANVVNGINSANVVNKIVNAINNDNDSNNIEPVTIKGEDLLRELLELLQRGDFIQPLAEADRLLLEKEKAKFTKVNSVSVTARRFAVRNRVSLIAGLGIFIVIIAMIASLARSRALLPTTAGMDSLQVVESYYNAIGDMNHQLMEACVTNGAGKNDIRMVINFFVVTRVRQSNEYRGAPVVVSPRDWQEGTVEIADTTLIFGVTDLSVAVLQLLPAGGSVGGAAAADGDKIIYKADYTIWLPVPAGDGMSPEEVAPPVSQPYHNIDTLTLIRKKGNWRISEIIRLSP